MTKTPHVVPSQSRREFLTRAGGGLGGLALAQLLAQDGYAAAISKNPLAPKKPHHEPTAKSVIFLFMEGGPSHLDLFDYKPALEKLAGQPMPESFGRPVTAMGTATNAIMPSQRSWKQHGESGIWVSDWYPHVAKHVDDLTVMRSCWQDAILHQGGVSQMNTGSVLGGRPSLGAWTVYGLGSENQDLPSFVVLTDDKEVTGGAKTWGNGFLPAAYQGTKFRCEESSAAIGGEPFDHNLDESTNLCPAVGGGSFQQSGFGPA